MEVQSSNNVNIAPPNAMAGTGKTIEQKELEHKKHTQMLWVYENEEMVHRSVTYVPGLYKFFDEILVGAAQSKQRDPSMDSLKVVIDVEKNLISVFRNGSIFNVPIKILKEILQEEVYVTKLVVESAIGMLGHKHEQVFFNNNVGKESKISSTRCNWDENWIKISLQLDLEKFKMSEDVVALMMKRVVNLAGCFKNDLKVELNGQLIKLESLHDYAYLYLKSAEKFRPRIHAKIGEQWEICITLSDGQFQQVSFVNFIATINGGTHVDYITNQITTYVNKKKNHAKVKVKAVHDVKNHLWIFVNALIDNPVFDSQTKETLTTLHNSFGSKCDVPESILKEVDTILSKHAGGRQSEDSKENKLTNIMIERIEKLRDASNAGTNQSQECTLILTEGDSALRLAVNGLKVVGTDFYGVYPLKGKLLNVRRANKQQILDNRQIQDIQTILGLEQDKVYSDTQYLRYGHLMILTDPDPGGCHIKGLIINFIHYFWPSLLKVKSFMLEFITPLLKAFHTNERPRFFYSLPQFEQWREKLGDNENEWEVQYYKGLASSSPEEGIEYFSNLDKHLKEFLWEDDHDGSAIEVVFSKGKEEDRKKWILDFKPDVGRKYENKYISYKDFVDKDLILFAKANLQRSIPTIIDGLKPSQRKIIFCALKKLLKKEMSVEDFSSYVPVHSNYRHGAQSISSTIINMAQNFVGSNNISLLTPISFFGSREKGGKDHGDARYIHTKLSPFTRALFPEDDVQLLDCVYDEGGKSIEPKCYMPVLPIILVNGCEAIATGWSSFIPNYDPREIISNIRLFLAGKEFKPMVPHYKGFKGTVEQTKTGVYKFSGKIEVVDEQTFRITELPIGTWSEDYLRFLQSVSEAKANCIFAIEDFKYHCIGEIVDIVVKLKEHNVNDISRKVLLKNFRLTTTLSTSNMHLLDAKGTIKKYDTPEEILLDFCQLRLENYQRRRVLEIVP